MNELSENRGLRSKSWRLPVFATCLGLAFFADRSANAGLLLSVQPTTQAVSAGGGGTFDVILTNSGPSSVTVGGFSFEINSNNLGLSLTGANISTAAPYIFGGSGFAGFNIATATGQTLDASDFFSVINSGATLGSGATVGLGHVSFSTLPGASGSATVSFSGFPFTSFSDQVGQNLTFTVSSGGTINITGGTTPVPEPATFGPAVLAILAGIWRVRSLRRKTA